MRFFEANENNFVIAKEKTLNYSNEIIIIVEFDYVTLVPCCYVVELCLSYLVVVVIKNNNMFIYNVLLKQVPMIHNRSQDGGKCGVYLRISGTHSLYARRINAEHVTHLLSSPNLGVIERRRNERIDSQYDCAAPDNPLEELCAHDSCSVCGKRNREQRADDEVRTETVILAVNFVARDGRDDEVCDDAEERDDSF